LSGENSSRQDSATSYEIKLTIYRQCQTDFRDPGMGCTMQLPSERKIVNTGNNPKRKAAAMRQRIEYPPRIDCCNQSFRTPKDFLSQHLTSSPEAMFSQYIYKLALLRNQRNP
jgi:hypothetical protein